MNQIEKYIQNELDTSRYRVRMLKRLNNLSPAKKRLLDREIEFLNIPFHTMSFSSVKEVSEAISLYQTSRFSFYEKYGCVDLSELCQGFEKKLEYLLDRRDELLSSRIEEVNPIQNPYFYNQIVKCEFEKGDLSKEKIEKKFSKLNISDMAKIEPAHLGKKRARVQAILYATGLYLQDELRDIPLPEESWESVSEGIKRLESIVYNIKTEVFRYYNLAIKILPEKLSGTMGQNTHIEKLHSLKDIMEDYPGSGYPVYKDQSFNENIPQVGYILFGMKHAVYQTIKKDGDNATKNRVYGILLPMERIGNEKLSLLYKKIVYNDIDISNIFSETLSNVKAIDHNGELTYFKSLMLKPLWSLFGGKSLTLKQNEILLKIVGVSSKEIHNGINKKALSAKINTTCTNFLNLSRDYSTILVARTRSEEDYLQEAVEIASGRINDIYVAFATND